MSYVGNAPFYGFIKSEEHISVGGIQYTLGRTAPSKHSIVVSVNGVIKRPSEYGLSGVVLTLAGVPVDDVILVRYLTTTGTTATYTQNQLADNIVTSSKIIDGAVTDEHIVSISADKITGTYGGTFLQEIFAGAPPKVDFLLTQDVAVAASIIVTVSGIHQVSPTHFTLSGTGNRTLSFNTAPAQGVVIYVVYLGLVTDIGVPSGGTLTPSMFAPGTIPVKFATNPTVTSAEINGYSIGTEWINTTDGNIFILTDDTAGANVWLGMTQRFDTLASLAGGQRGAIITHDTNGNWVALAPGNAGQVLTSGGFAKDAEWVGGWIEAENNKTSLEIVTVDSGKLVINGVSQPALTLYEGNTYKFDISNGSNLSHNFSFATEADGANSSSYTPAGVTTNGTPGQSGAYTQIVVAANAPDLYYYCPNHPTMGGTASTSSAVLVDPGKDYIVDTSSVAISVALPKTPIVGDVIRFVDKTGTFRTNKFTIERNGKKIERMDYDLVLEGGPHMELVYVSAVDGWIRTDTDGADWKYITTADGVITTTYAASALDTLQEDRTSDITVTSNLTIGSGSIDNLVDGGHTINSAESITMTLEVVDATKYIQFAFETPQIITEVRMYAQYNNTMTEVPTLTVTGTASEDLTPGETITGNSSGATGTVILGVGGSGNTPVTYIETSGATRFVAETITGGTSGFTKTIPAVADNQTPHGIWQWQASATGVWGGEEVNIGAEWALHNEGLEAPTGAWLGGAAGYIDRTELSANTTGYNYYRMKGVRGATQPAPSGDWVDWYFTRQDSTQTVPTFVSYCNSSYFVDTTAGTFTATLPAMPAINDYVEFGDQASKFATNKLIVGRNGKNIQTLAEDLELNIANSSTRLTYTGTTNGWVLS